MKITNVGRPKATHENRDGAETASVSGAAENHGTRKEPSPGEIRISVRGLVEFLLRTGDIDNRHYSATDTSMQEGNRIHRMIQRRMGAEYEAEVPLKFTLSTKSYKLIVEGRADGIFSHEGRVVIDEIKGTWRELARMREPVPLHVAQAKCYAYMYGLQKGLAELQVRMTYCNFVSEDIRYFFEDYNFRDLKEWFEGLITAYRRWADYAWQWREIRQDSIEGLKFPFPYREGQKELITNVYSTIYHGRKLFLEAPTGAGKTISTVYPAVLAMGRGMGDKLFYLTAKTIVRTVAEDTLNILRRDGLRFKSVILTAKEKICFMEKADCNPEACPYAKGHYDRINDALFDLLTSEEGFTREKIEDYAQKHQVCPFELCLDTSLFADGIICDYNYLFDPHVYLKRFFGDGNGGSYLFLIDEAHNLLERGREMYSAGLYKETFLELRREIKETILSEMDRKGKKSDISGQMTLKMTLDSTEMSRDKKNEIDQYGLQEKETQYELAPNGSEYQNQPRAGAAPRRAGKSVLVRQGYGEKLTYLLEKCNQELLVLKREGGLHRVVENIDGFVRVLDRLHAAMDDYLSEQEEEKLPVRERLLDFYFETGHFLDMYELADENYVKYTQLCDDERFLIKLFCVNPGGNLKGCMQRGRSSILFSATFLPIQYYKKLLGGEPEDYEVYAQSVFRPEKRALFIAGDVTSKYIRRSEEEYGRIARYIEEIVRNRHGNYLVFCPSYAFLRTVCEKYTEKYAGHDRECIIQNEYMSESGREEFLAHFRGAGEDRVLIGFCVLGGIFGEGIDLRNDSLIGAVIVGTGLPQVCFEREILKDYFSEHGESGFDYSYRYPGMNKVLQAAGRVIRTVEDVGIVALLDERFLQPAYRRLLPREWKDFETVTVETVSKRVERFWNEWL